MIIRSRFASSLSHSDYNSQTESTLHREYGPEVECWGFERLRGNRGPDEARRPALLLVRVCD
jgi:hypothetical protein